MEFGTILLKLKQILSKLANANSKQIRPLSWNTDHGPRARYEPTVQHYIDYQTGQINIAMHDLPGVVGTGVGVVGTEKNKQKVMHFREGLLISLFPRFLSPHVINSKGKVTMLTQIIAKNNKLCLANSPYKRKLHEGCVLRYCLQMIPSTQIPLFASLAFSYKSLKESTLNTLLGPEAIWLSSVVSTSSPIPKTNTAAPLL